jgi:hypothetical protein
MEDKVIKVNIDTDKIDRLELKVQAKEQSIKYLENENIKLKHKLDSKENWGLNCLLFSYDELVEILTHKSHAFYEYIYRWFEDIKDCDFEFNKTLYFGEEGIEINKGEYWLVHVKNDYAVKLNDLSQLNRKIYELEKRDLEVSIE